MSLHKLFALVITVALLGGCNALAGKTNMLSDDDECKAPAHWATPLRT